MCYQILSKHIAIEKNTYKMQKNQTKTNKILMALSFFVGGITALALETLVRNSKPGPPGVTFYEEIKREDVKSYTWLGYSDKGNGFTLDKAVIPWSPDRPELKRLWEAAGIKNPHQGASPASGNSSIESVHILDFSITVLKDTATSQPAP